jgi:hypothetical protein
MALTCRWRSRPQHHEPTLHAWFDLRRTYRSIHGQIGTASEIAERLINHAAAVQTEVEEIYDRWTYLPQMQTAVLAFENHFKALWLADPASLPFGAK